MITLALSDPVRYYETKKWGLSSLAGFPEVFIERWCHANGLQFLTTELIKRVNLTGSKLIELHRKSSLKQELKISEEEEQLLRKAIEKQDHRI